MPRIERHAPAARSQYIIDARRGAFKATTYRVRSLTARNDACICGSGRRYKHCCGVIGRAGAQSAARGETATAPAGIAELISLLQAGRIAELERRTRTLLGRYPNFGPAWQMLGTALALLHQDPLPALQRTVELMPEEPGAHVNLGNALARQGRFDEAIASHDRALALDPGLVEAHNNRGHVLLEMGQPAQALESYRRAIELRPAFAEAHDNAGSALLELGRTAEAAHCFRQAIDYDPNGPAAHTHLGNALFAAGQYERAIASYRRALELEPRCEAVYVQLGNALHELGRLDEALLHYRKALEINPACAEAHNNVGSLMRGWGRLEEAIECFGRALELRPDFVEAHGNMGLSQRLMSRPQEAQASCLRALAIKPGFTPALATLAETHADTGDFEAAERRFREAISHDADSPEAWAGIARLRKMTRQDTAWLAEAERIAELPLAPRREAPLRYALGKYFDDVGEFDAAFAHYRRANELKKCCRLAHDPNAVTQGVLRIIQTQDRRWLATARRAHGESERPIFVVGMLRSGTTLAEQILAAHPNVFGAGELPFWSAAAQRAEERPLEALADDYLRCLAALAPHALRVVDKMPANFLCLGLIHAALPHARIIHMRRDPLDTCLSIYFQHFETAVSYSNDLEDLARYHEDYSRLMRHWRSMLPAGSILDVPYEELVRDPGSWSRRMLEHVGLPWDARCLDVQRTSSTVITASKWQVRQAIHTASIGRWRNYEKFLAPLLRLAPTETPR